MEFLSELLREACTCFLLSFLVVRFLSLIVSSSDDDNKEVKLSTEFDHCLHNHVGPDDSFGEKKQLEIDGFKGVNDANETDNEMIKYFDLNDKIKDMIVRDIDIVSKEVNAIDEDFRGSFIKDMDDQEVSEFVDHDEKRFVGGEFDSGKNVGGVVDQLKKESIMEFEQGKNHDDDIGVNLGREECDEVERANNVYKGEVSGREFDIEDEEVLSDDEDWEGIERSELEKTFARAMNYVGTKEKQKLLGENIDNDVMMQFYGLQKIAMEGPCYEAQPLAIKRSSRAKWNAWQKLGSMTQEDAMEEYISLLSGIIPEWMEANSTAKE